ncbi:MAG: hypothetical protein IKU94_00610 [Bacteroidaceae bacterium]|nr:hypothetical protein [Bacteroidaceae bacterium]MBR4930462.1 hypothetical protein [Bacteroidaceae bacterium]
MKKGIKMLMLADRMDDDAESRFRDRRGREHYDNGKFAPMRSAYYEDEYEPESRGYRRYSDGRFAPRSEKESEMYSPTPFVPPIYERGERGVNPIGFVPGGYSTYATHKHGDEMEHRTSKMEHGGAYGKTTKLTREMADEWTGGLRNEDGSTGPHWTMDQVKQVMSQRNIKSDPVEFFAVMNSLYSDYCKVFQKHNVNKIDLYADLTSAWLEDEDAEDGKAALYFEHIVKK